jgi:hypothetical protein
MNGFYTGPCMGVKFNHQKFYYSKFWTQHLKISFTYFEAHKNIYYD